MEFNNVKSFSIPEGVVTNISANGVTIWNIESGSEQPTTVTFTIQGTSYTVTEGTTWAEFVLDVGNPDSPNYSGPWYIADNGYVGEAGGLALLDDQGEYVKGSDIIRSIEYTTAGIMPEEIQGTQSTVTFTINGTEYTVTEGTTWSEWVATTNGSYYLEQSGADIFMIGHEGRYIAFQDGTYVTVSESDAIVAGDYILN